MKVVHNIIKKMTSNQPVKYLGNDRLFYPYNACGCDVGHQDIGLKQGSQSFLSQCPLTAS